MMTMIETTTASDMAALSAEVGFDVAATLKDYQRDCRLGHCNHPECHQEADRRFAQHDEVEDAGGSYPAVVPMTEDGRIDKQALREERLFGSSCPVERSLAAIGEGEIDWFCN